MQNPGQGVGGHKEKVLALRSLTVQLAHHSYIHTYTHTHTHTHTHKTTTTKNQRSYSECVCPRRGNVEKNRLT
jgi:hypothetical protein